MKEDWLVCRKISGLKSLGNTDINNQLGCRGERPQIMFIKKDLKNSFFYLMISLEKELTLSDDILFFTSL
jgi:hypothetical protein